jgi:hypothetical protein
VLGTGGETTDFGGSGRPYCLTSPAEFDNCRDYEYAVPISLSSPGYRCACVALGYCEAEHSADSICDFPGVDGLSGCQPEQLHRTFLPPPAFAAVDTVLPLTWEDSALPPSELHLVLRPGETLVRSLPDCWEGAAAQATLDAVSLSVSLATSDGAFTGEFRTVLFYEGENWAFVSVSRWDEELFGVPRVPLDDFAIGVTFDIESEGNPAQRFLHFQVALDPTGLQGSFSVYLLADDENRTVARETKAAHFGAPILAQSAIDQAHSYPETMPSSTAARPPPPPPLSVAP